MTSKLKAWVVSEGEWSELLHAETSGKARSKAVGLFSGASDDTGENFLYFRATRFPKADGRAFTLADRWEADGHWQHDADYISECDCAFCSPKLVEVER